MRLIYLKIVKNTMIQTVFIFNVGNGIECETKQGVFNKEKERNEAEIERTKGMKR